MVYFSSIFNYFKLIFRTLKNCIGQQNCLLCLSKITPENLSLMSKLTIVMQWGSMRLPELSCRHLHLVIRSGTKDFFALSGVLVDLKFQALCSKPRMNLVFDIWPLLKDREVIYLVFKKAFVYCYLLTFVVLRWIHLKKFVLIFILLYNMTNNIFIVD